MTIKGQHLKIVNKAKKRSLIKARQVIVSGMMFLIILGSCDSNSLISDDVVSDEDFNISLLKDLALDFSTMRLDSLTTSTTGTVTIGSNQQPNIGITTHMACFQPGLDISAYSNLKNTVDFESLSFDSLSIVLVSNGDNYYESGEYTTFYVDQFLTPLELLDNGYLYNTSVPPSDRIRVGSKTFRSNLEEGDELIIDLSDSLGQAIFDLMAADDEIFSSTSDFVDFIGGFNVYVRETSPILSFYADSLKMRMYYTDNTNIPPTTAYFDFSIDNEIYYTHTINELESKFDGLESSFEDYLSADSTDQLTYISGASLLGTVIDFPGVEILALEEQDYILAHAELRLYPESESASDLDKLPETLVAYFIDEDNNTITSQDEFITATLTFDDTYKRDTYYTIEVSALIEIFLTPFTQYNYSLLVMLPYAEVTNNPKSLMIEDGSMRSELILYTLEN